MRDISAMELAKSSFSCRRRSSSLRRAFSALSAAFRESSDRSSCPRRTNIRSACTAAARNPQDKRKAGQRTDTLGTGDVR